MSDNEVSADSMAEHGLSRNAGDALRQAREAAGLHIAALAMMLKVPVKKLEALESNRFDLLPDAVFVRALTASICRSLKTDSATILALLPATPTPELRRKPTSYGFDSKKQFRLPGEVSRPSHWVQLSWPVVLSGVTLLLGALVFVFLPVLKASFQDSKFTFADFSVASLINTATPKYTEVVNQPKTSEGMTESTVRTSANVFQTSLLDKNIADTNTAKNKSATANAALSDTNALRLESALVTSTQTLVMTGKPAATPDVIVFIPKGESWVEVVDAKGQMILRRTLISGEVVELTGLLPLKVLVGRADMTQVQIRGIQFDLKTVSKDNVARFEVK